jgi:hypothetical protein
MNNVRLLVLNKMEKTFLLSMVMEMLGIIDKCKRILKRGILRVIMLIRYLGIIAIWDEFSMLSF